MANGVEKKVKTYPNIDLCIVRECYQIIDSIEFMVNFEYNTFVFMVILQQSRCVCVRTRYEFFI